jgi:hypothetical protein
MTPLTVLGVELGEVELIVKAVTLETVPLIVTLPVPDAMVREYGI